MGAFFAPLVALFSAGVRWLFGFFSGLFMSKLGAVIGVSAVLLIFVQLVYIFISVCIGLISPITAAYVPSSISGTFGCVLPNNFVPCVSALLTARLLSLFYTIKVSYFSHVVRVSIGSIFSRIWSAVKGK